MRARLRSLALSLVALLAAPALAADEITWLTMDFPPFYVHHGAERGQGIADTVMRRLQAHLAGYAHREELAEPAAIMARMKAGERVCSAAYIRTPERERVLAFSLPALVLPPNGITVRRDALARFGEARPVRLAQLLQNRQLRGAVAVGRAYGAGIDPLLEGHKASPHLYRRRGEDIYSSLFDMLVKGSVDYIVGYPYEALFLARERGVEGQVVSLPLAESAEFTLAHVVCPLDDWGRRVIAQVDAALAVERARPEYRQAIERWLDPALHEEFRRQYAARFAPR